MHVSGYISVIISLLLKIWVKKSLTEEFYFWFLQGTYIESKINKNNLFTKNLNELYQFIMKELDKTIRTQLNIRLHLILGIIRQC